MMSAMRKNTAIILWILVFAFIATIVFSWGMGGFKGQMEPGVIGKVNNKKITQEMYDQAVQNRLQYERQNSEEPLTENRIQTIRNDVWEGFINEYILDEWREKAGIEVSDREVAYAVRNFPPQQIVQNPSFRDSTGQFDRDLYNRIINDPGNVQYVIQIESSVRQQLKQQKIVQRISTGSHVSDVQAKENYLRENSKASISYLLSEWKDQKVDSSTVTDAEMREYYNKNKEDFKQIELRTAEYVLFPEEASPEDSTEARDIIVDLKRQVEGGADFAELATEYSMDTGTAENGGDLGWFGKDKMVKEFEEAAKNAEIGKLVGPVPTQYGYHLIFVTDKRGEGDDFEIKASHILIKVEAGPQTIEDIQSRAQGFREEAEESGFDAAMEIFNVTSDTLENLSRRGFFPRLGRNQAASEFLYNQPMGSITPVYNMTRGFAIMRVIDMQPEGYRSFEEAKEQLRKEVVKEKQYEKSLPIAKGWYEEIKSNGTMEEVAEKNGLEVVATKRSFGIDDYVSGVTRDPIFRAKVFDMEVGEIASPLRGMKGYYVVRLDSLETPDMENWDDKKEMEKAKITRSRQQAIYDSWLTIAKAQATIEDYRYLYYTSY
ncbi:peptidylprolyl isomerase [bacterium]|nr:peptidylprolyl isomerase [bacterium]